jgi:RNA polymerase-binding transcription factor DksA
MKNTHFLLFEAVKVLEYVRSGSAAGNAPRTVDQFLNRPEIAPLVELARTGQIPDAMWPPNGSTTPPDQRGDLATQQGREAALEALRFRRANPPEKIDNAKLNAGAPIYFYCISCGHVADVKPETYMFPPAKLCKECQALKELGWLE